MNDYERATVQHSERLNAIERTMTELKTDTKELVSELKQYLKTMEKRNDESFKTVDESFKTVSEKISEMNAILNKGKGALAASLVAASSVGSFVTFIGTWIAGKIPGWH